MTIERQIEIIRNMFDQYVEFVAGSFMYGQVPSTVFMIHRTGSKEKDWLASVRFRNTITISVFRCEVWMEDIDRLCRKCKIYLLTEPIYEVISLYFMLHPLYQTQYVDFSHNDVVLDYDSMIAGAGKATYKFIKKHFPFHDPVQKTVLEMLNYYNMMITNQPYQSSTETLSEAMESVREIYVGYMMNRHYYCYKHAIHYKASNALLDADGFMIMERLNKNKSIQYVRDENVDKISKEEAEKKPKKRAMSQKPIARGIDYEHYMKQQGNEVQTLKRR